MPNIGSWIQLATKPQDSHVLVCSFTWQTESQIRNGNQEGQRKERTKTASKTLSFPFHNLKRSILLQLNNNILPFLLHQPPRLHPSSAPGPHRPCTNTAPIPSKIPLNLHPIHTRLEIIAPSQTKQHTKHQNYIQGTCCLRSGRIGVYLDSESGMVVESVRAVTLERPGKGESGD